MAEIKFVNPATYLKNVTRSISYSALDVTKEMIPAGADLVENNSEILKEVITTVRQPKKSLRTLGSYIKGSKVYEAGELAIKATLEDIATGNFYNKQRMEEINVRASGEGGLLDFEGLEIDFDELDADIARSNEEDERVTKGEKYVGEMVAESSFASSQAISKSVVASGKYVAETTKASSALMYNLNVKGFEMIGKGVGSVNENLTQIVNFTNVTIKDYMQKTLKQHDEMLSLQKEQTVLLKNIHDMQAALQSKPSEQKTPKANRYSDVMSGGTLDIKEYAKLVYNNVIENTPLKSLASMNDAMGDNGNILLTFAAAPLKTISDFLVKKAIPDILEQSMTQFNETLSGFFGTMLYRLTNASNNEDSFLGEWISKIFGVKTSVKTSLDTSNYQKGPIPFDGVTKKAIIETIPGYLARIESALTGREERFFDYKSGSWKNYGDVKRETDNIKKRSVENATGDMRREIEYKALNQMKWNSPTDIENFYKDLDKFFNSLYDGKKYFDPTNKKLKGSDFDISDENFAIISQLFRNSQQGMQTAFYGKIMEARDNQNRMMMDLENSGDSIYNISYNNSGSLNNYDTKSGRMLETKYGLGNLLNQKDKFGKSIFDWLKYQSEKLVEISYNTANFYGKKPKNNSGTNQKTDTFNASEALRSGMELKEVETISEKIKKDRKKEFEKYFNDNQKTIEKLKKKNYPIFDTEQLMEMSEDDYSSYMSDLSRTIRTTDALEKSKEDQSNDNEKLFKTPDIFKKLKTYMDKPGQFVADIFNKADKRLYNLMFGSAKELTTVNGKPVSSVLELMKVKFEIFFDELSDKISKIFNPIIERVKEFLNPFVESAKNAAKPLFDSTKDAFKSAGGWVKDGFKSAYSPVKNLFEGDGSWGTKKRVSNIDDVDMLADGTRMMGKTGLAILSEGEMVIPQHLNPFYKGNRTPIEQQRRNEKLVKNNLISKLASNAAKFIPTYADGKVSADGKLNTKEKYIKIDGKWYDYETEKEVSREEVEQYNIVNKNAFDKSLENISSGAKGIFGELKRILFGDEGTLKINEGVQKVSNELFEKALGDIKGDKIGYGGKAIAGGIIGAGASLLSGGLLSPMLAAALGSATSIVISSEKTRNWLFGVKNDKGDYEGGVIPNKLVKAIVDYVPSMAKHGAVGALTAMLPFVPGGPVAGLMVGSAVGFMKQNESVQNWLFGEDGLFGKSKEEIGQILKQKLPNILGGAGLGAAAGLVLGGPFGLVGNMMIGGGLGFLSTTEKFQMAIFGKDKDGNVVQEGLVQKLGKWVKKNVLDQLKDFIKPFTNRIIHFVDRLGKGAGGFFSRQFEKWVGIPIGRAINEYLIKPMSKIVKPFLGVGKFLAKAAVSPFSILGGIGRRMQRKDLKTGNSAYLGNAAARLKRREELGMRTDDFYGNLDTVLQRMSVEDLEEASTLIGKTQDERIANRNNQKEARRQLQSNLSNVMGAKFKIKDIKKISDLIEKGKIDEAANLLIGGKLIPSAQNSRFKNNDNKEELIEVFKTYGMQYNSQVKNNESYEKKLEAALKKSFGSNNPIVEQIMSGRSGELRRLLDKEAKSRTPEEKTLEEANKKEDKFRYDLLDHIKAIRAALTGEKLPSVTETVEVSKEEDSEDPLEAMQNAQISMSAKKRVVRRGRDLESIAKENAKLNELTEKETKVRTIFTSNGPMRYIKDSKGEPIPDLRSKVTRETMKDESAEDASLLKTSSFLEKISGFFGIKKKDKDDEEPSMISKILGKAGSALKFLGGGLGKVLLGATAIGAAGQGINAISQTGIGQKINSWLFGGTDEEGNKTEGLLTKIGKVFVEKVPEIAAKIKDFIVDSIIGAAEFVTKNSETVGNWISSGIQMFTNSIVKLLEGAPKIAEALGTALPYIINPIGKAIPPLIESISENIGPVLNALGDSLPAIGRSLANAAGTLVRQVPTILKSLIGAAADIAPTLAKTLLIEIPKAFFSGILGIAQNESGSTEEIKVDENGNVVKEGLLSKLKNIFTRDKNTNTTQTTTSTSTTDASYSNNYTAYGSTNNGSYTTTGAYQPAANYTEPTTDESNAFNTTGGYEPAVSSAVSNTGEGIEVTVVDEESGEAVGKEVIYPGDSRYEEVSRALRQQKIEDNSATGDSSLGELYTTEGLVISAAHAATLGIAVKAGTISKLGKVTQKSISLSTKVGKRIGKVTKQLVVDKRERNKILKASKKNLKKELAAHSYRGRAMNKVSESFSKVTDAAKNKASELLKSATDNLKGKAAKVGEFVKKATDDIAEKIGPQMKKLWSKIISIPYIGKYLKGAGEACNKFIKKLIPAVTKAAGKTAAKTALKILGTVLNIVLVIYKFSDGFANAESYLKVEDATTGQKVISGLLAVVNEYITLGLVPLETILDLFYNTIGKALGIDDEIKEQQQQLKEATELYNEDNDTNLSVSEYQKQVLGQEKGFKGIVNSVKNVFTSKTSTNRNIRENNRYNRTSTGIRGGYNKAGMGSSISSLITQIDPNAPQPILSQVDPRIANKKFGNSTVGKSGCAPSSAAIILNDMKDTDVDIRDTMKPALKYQNEDGSVKAEYFKDVFSKYGYNTDYIEKKDKALSEIRKGQELVLLGQDSSNTSKAKSPFGLNSHFVVASNYKDGKITIADPETGKQVAYDKSILNSIELAVAPRKRSGSGSRLRRFAGSGGLTASQVKQNKDIIFNYLVTNMGLSTAAAVGIMTNIKHESGFDPGIMEYGYSWNDGAGFGLCQWTNYPRTSGKGNRTNLVNYAKKRGKDKSDLVLQLDFLKSELDSGYSKMMTRLRSYPNTEQGAGDAAKDFCVTFERPADTEKTGEKRRKASKELWEEYKNQKGGPVVGSSYSSSSSSSSSDGSLGGLLSNLTSELMKNAYGEDIMSLFGMSTNGDETSTSSSGEIITNSSATTAKDWFTQTLGGKITSPFGPRIHPIRGTQSFHGGIDIGANGGTKIPSPVSGTVDTVNYSQTGYGNLLVLKDQKGGRHYFGHLQKKPTLKVGDTVMRGQEVGLVGTTGSSTGNHLHYEIRKPNASSGTDPDVYLQDYISNGGSGSGISSPYRNIDKSKFDPSGPKGGEESSIIDINILEALVSVITKILDDTHNIAQIKDLIAEYLMVDKDGGKNAKDNTKKQKAAESIVNVVTTNKSESNNVDERKAIILKQLQAIIAG